MSDELRFINAFIGFCTPMGNTWPGPFVRLKYQVVGIERGFTVSVDGELKQVTPDLMCCSETVQHVFLLEAKGATLSVEQSRKYQVVTDGLLVATNYLVGAFDQYVMSHDVLYIVVPANTETLARQMDDNGVAFPLIAGDTACFGLHAGTITQSDMERAFSEGVAITPEHEWPTHFVQFNHNSKLEDMVAPVISNATAFIMGNEDFTSREVAERAISHLPYCGAPEATALLNKVHKLLERASRQELQPYFRTAVHRARPLHDRDRPWSVSGNRPMPPQSMMALQKHATTFVYRVQHRLPYRRNQPALPGFDL